MLDFLGSLFSAGMNFLGGERNRDAQMALAAQNQQMQREFAQSGIRWRVEDAKAAGLHPLAALGAQTTSFSPVSVGDVGGGFSAAGQDIGRAISAMKTKDEKAEAISERANELALEKGSLENQLLRTQIRRLNSPGTGPGMPSTKKVGSNYDGNLVAGQPATGVISRKSEREFTAPGDASKEYGAVPDVGYVSTGSGHAPVPSKDVKDRIEDVMPAEWAWALRNMGAPTVGLRYRPPNLPLKENHEWGYDPFTQEYFQVPRIRGPGLAHHRWSRPTHNDAFIRNTNRR